MKKIVRAILLAALTLSVVAAFAHAKGNSDKSEGWLGVYTQSVDDEMAKGFKLATSTGAIINEVVKDSPADLAGLRENDIVILVDGSPIKEADQFVDVIRDHTSGDVVNLTVLRDGKEQKFKVTLGDKSSLPDESPFVIGKSYAPRAQAFRFETAGDPDVYIGVELTGLTDQLRGFFGVSGENGVLVSSVKSGSPAEKAGIKAGDVILKVDGKGCGDADDVIDVIGDKAKGDKVDLALMRDHKEMHLNVEVAENEYAGNHRRTMKTFALPDIGKIQGRVMPRMHGLWYGTEDDDKYGDDMREELKDLRTQMEDLRRQLDELKSARK